MPADFTGLRCPNCHSARILHHPELHDLQIAHVDCDAFFAAVEKRDRPELANKPVIIGGGTRGVVSTACYLARIHGVRSAMPMFKAKKLCPDAVVLKPSMTKYRTVSHQLRALFCEMTPLVEPLSVDEAFLDLTGTASLAGASPAQQLAKLAQRVEQELGITVSVGLSHNKFLAKLASDLQKPRGFSIIGKAETLARLADMPINTIYGIGKRTTESLARDGLTHISQLQEMDESTLVRRYGETGMRLYRLARGIDKRPVKSERIVKSVSAETTLSRDATTLAELEMPLAKACDQVARDLKRKDIAGRTVTLKLKTNMHRIISRSRTIDRPTQMSHMLVQIGTDLLTREVDGRSFRLIGIGVSQLESADNADQADLLEPGIGKRHDAERAIDAINAKFGTGSVGLGRLVAPTKHAEARKKKPD